MESRRQTIIAPPPALLEFRFATFPAGEEGQAGCEKVNVTLRTGELMMLWQAPGAGTSILADAAQGLATPSRGSVWFLGNDWGPLSRGAAAKLRASIGRVFRDRAWQGNKRLKDEILQRVRHHPWGARKSLTTEAEAMARRLGLPALPAERGPELPPSAQKSAQWVRALAGRPELIILEWPLTDADPELVPPFLEELAAARARGAAILWLTDGTELSAMPDLRISQQWDVADGTIRPRTEAS
jgi:ABC-type transporter Mla maintaining outer membrane lipid asymmetry ATPase subunit MlaF